MRARLVAGSLGVLVAAAGCGGDVTGAGPATAGEQVERSSRPIARAEAVSAARRSASEFLTMARLGFGVEPDDWVVGCVPRKGGTVWDCRVEQGPCSGELEVRRVTIGGQIRGLGEIGCVGE